jgi:hypothetical protein
MTVAEIRKMRDFLLGWEDRREIVTYKIEEKLTRNIDTYDVKNLSVDFEDGCIYFSDIDDVILNNEKSVLKGFLISSSELGKIYKDHFTILLRDGIVYINVI